MEILQIEIDKIKPDKKQPRKSIEIEDLKEMAQSIVTEGVINPIETDSDFVIITGERRWRASKIAGLKTVPVKVLKINAKERFRRQVIENIHNDTMSYDDTARALSKLKVDYFHPVKVINKGQPQTGVTFLSKMVGKSLGYIEERFDYLKASAPLQKAVKDAHASAMKKIQRIMASKMQEMGDLNLPFGKKE